jgi:hypothetical protein
MAAGSYAQAAAILLGRCVPGAAPEYRLLRLPAVRDNAAMQTDPPKPEPPKRKHPWFQFSLRTLLITVTALAVPCWWVATQKRLIEDRRELLSKIEKVYRGVWYVEQLPPGTSSAISGLRRLLGDQAVSVIVLPLDADAKIYPTIHDLFPEAQLQVGRAIARPRVAAFKS